VQFVEQHRVTGLLSNAGQTQVTGVRLHSLAGDGLEQMPATLVVDASGRRSAAPQWLESLGFTPPPKTVVNPFLGYATRRYREPEGFEGRLEGDANFATASKPSSPRIFGKN
jgi:hypothetical protein